MSLRDSRGRFERAHPPAIPAICAIPEPQIAQIAGIAAPGESENRERIARLRRERREKVHARVRSMMARDDTGRTHFYLTDDTVDAEHVILVIGIRGVGTAELEIPRDRYDPFALAGMLAEAHPPDGTHIETEPPTAAQPWK